ncbi:hypothetical protein NU195Hw_g2783t1 [Hortaea werneckii]
MNHMTPIIPLHLYYHQQLFSYLCNVILARSSGGERLRAAATDNGGATDFIRDASWGDTQRPVREDRESHRSNTVSII